MVHHLGPCGCLKTILSLGPESSALLVRVMVISGPRLLQRIISVSMIQPWSNMTGAYVDIHGPYPRAMKMSGVWAAI